MTNEIKWTHDGARVTLADYPGYVFDVTHDLDASDPVADSGAPVEMYAARGGYRSTLGDNTGYWIDAHKRFEESFGDDAADVLKRFAVAFHGWDKARADDAIHFGTYRGYSQSDWLDVLTVVTEDGYGMAEGWFEEWSQWARGDVYTVGAERFEECDCDCQATHTSREKDNGNELIYVGGIYADDVEEAATYYAGEDRFSRAFSDRSTEYP